MAKRVGATLSFLMATNTVTTPTSVVAISVMRGWTYEETDVDVETTAAGDTYVDRDTLRGDFEINFNALLQIASPYVIRGAEATTLRGQKVLFSGKILTADTNGIVSGTAKFDSFRIEGRHDGTFEISGRMRSAGTAPTWNLTPA